MGPAIIPPPNNNASPNSASRNAVFVQGLKRALIRPCRASEGTICFSERAASTTRWPLGRQAFVAGCDAAPQVSPPFERGDRRHSIHSGGRLGKRRHRV